MDSKTEKKTPIVNDEKKSENKWKKKFVEAKNKENVIKEAKDAAESTICEVSAAEFVAAVYYNGVKLEDGFEIERDVDTYKKFIKLAINAGSLPSMLHCSRFLIENKENDKASELLAHAAEMGSGEALNSLGVLAVKGGDAVKGIGFFEKAIAKDVEEAKKNLKFTLTRVIQALQEQQTSFIKKLSDLK